SRFAHPASLGQRQRRPTLLPAMKTLAFLILGSLVTAVLLTLVFLLVRSGRKRGSPVYWLGLMSAAAWFPVIVLPSLKAVLAKDHQMPIFDLVIAAILILPVLGVWSLLCSIPVRIAESVYARLRARK